MVFFYVRYVFGRIIKFKWGWDFLFVKGGLEYLFYWVIVDIKLRYIR